MPWLYQRARLAALWGVVPWAVDEAPWSEVRVAWQLLEMTGALEQVW